MRFINREEAGKQLVERLSNYREEDGVVFGIPRGGVLVAKPIAKSLGWPMDLVITRKVGHPSNPEYAICVVAEDGHRIGNEEELARMDQRWLEGAVKKEMEEAKRRRIMYMSGRERVAVRDKTALLVDDGVATGLTFLAAVKELHHLKPKRIVAVLPVMPAEFKDDVLKVVDEVVCLNSDPGFVGAVGAYYDDFPQVSDEEVISLFKEEK